MGSTVADAYGVGGGDGAGRVDASVKEVWAVVERVTAGEVGDACGVDRHSSVDSDSLCSLAKSSSGNSRATSIDSRERSNLNKQTRKHSERVVDP
jgi:hypothetical protein